MRRDGDSDIKAVNSKSELADDENIARLYRIESILRNALPTDDDAAANAISLAHAEVEGLLESLGIPEWWVA